MSHRSHMAADLRFESDSQRHLDHYDPADRCGFAGKADAHNEAGGGRCKHERLTGYLKRAERNGILIVLQGMDSAVKDGAIKHVMSGVNAQGVSLRAFKRLPPKSYGTISSGATRAYFPNAAESGSSIARITKMCR